MRRNPNKKFRFEDSPVESPVSVVGKSPCGQVDCLKELDPTLRQKVLNVDTDFLSNPYKLAHEKEGEQQYLFIDVCPCMLQIELRTLAPR
jgi:hypothetical protein